VPERCQCSLTTRRRLVVQFYTVVVRRASATRVLSPLHSADFTRQHERSSPARSSSLSAAAAAAAAACHAEHEMQHYYRSIDSQDGLASVGPA